MAFTIIIHCIVSVLLITRSVPPCTAQRLQSAASLASGLNVSFLPSDKLVLREDLEEPKNLTVILPPTIVSGHQIVHIGLEGDSTVVVDGLPTVFNISRIPGTTHELTVKLLGVRLGRGRLTVEVENEVMRTPAVHEDQKNEYEVLVVRGGLTTFGYCALLILASGMSIILFSASCYVEIDAILNHLRHPAGLLIGCLCQFVLTPVTAYTLGLLFGLSPTMHYALMLLGCGPGAGSSNFVTLTLGGDLSLSVLMTFTSSLLSVGLIPLWMTTLGQTILRQDFPGLEIYVPWMWFLGFTLMFTVPSVIGVAIHRFCPRASPTVAIVARVIGYVLLYSGLGMVIHNSAWIHDYLGHDWRAVVATSIDSHISYIISYALAYAVSRGNSLMTLTITIEAGIQALQSPTFGLMYGAPRPESQLAMVVIATYFYHLMGTVCLALLVDFIIRWIRRRRGGTSEDGAVYSVTEAGGDKISTIQKVDNLKWNVVELPGTAGKFEQMEKY